MFIEIDLDMDVDMIGFYYWKGTFSIFQTLGKEMFWEDQLMSYDPKISKASSAMFERFLDQTYEKLTHFWNEV